MWNEINFIMKINKDTIITKEICWKCSHKYFRLISCSYIWYKTIIKSFMKLRTYEIYKKIIMCTIYFKIIN
jgi:hypothetical protein